MSQQTCKLAYAADGTLICDPKQKPNTQGTYKGTPTCPNTKCTIYDKKCKK